MSRLPTCTSRAKLDEPEQRDRQQCVTSLATSNASTNDLVSDEYAVIDEDRSTSTAAVRFDVTITSNFFNENTPAPDMSRNTLVVRFVLHWVHCAH